VSLVAIKAIREVNSLPNLVSCGLALDVLRSMAISMTIAFGLINFVNVVRREF